MPKASVLLYHPEDKILSYMKRRVLVTKLAVHAFSDLDDVVFSWVPLGEKVVICLLDGTAADNTFKVMDVVDWILQKDKTILVFMLVGMRVVFCDPARRKLDPVGHLERFINNHKFFIEMGRVA